MSDLSWLPKASRDVLLGKIEQHVAAVLIPALDHEMLTEYLMGGLRGYRQFSDEELRNELREIDGTFNKSENPTRRIDTRGYDEDACVRDEDGYEIVVLHNFTDKAFLVVRREYEGITGILYGSFKYDPEYLQQSYFAALEFMVRLVKDDHA